MIKDIEEWLDYIEDDHDYEEIAREDNMKLLSKELGISFLNI